jgi:hypothetical protein
VAFGKATSEIVIANIRIKAIAVAFDLFVKVFMYFLLLFFCGA